MLWTSGLLWFWQFFVNCDRSRQYLEFRLNITSNIHVTAVPCKNTLCAVTFPLPLSR